jgi:hypothetical protein
MDAEVGWSVSMCHISHVRKFFHACVGSELGNQYFCMNMFVELVNRVLSVNESITLMTALRDF